MLIKRNQLYSSLFGIAKTLPGVNSFYQRIVPFEKLDHSQYPVLFQRQVSEEVINPNDNMPAHYKAMIDYIICVSTPLDTNTDPCILLNPLVDQFEAIFANLNYQTGLVPKNIERIVIDGQLGYFETLIDPQQISCISIPVNVYLT